VITVSVVPIAANRTVQAFPDPERTRRVLLASALELFGTKGFHASSVQEIVRAAGLTKGAFYHHFASKEDVLLLLLEELLAAQGRLVPAALAAYSAPADQLRELVRLWVLTVVRYQAHVAVSLQERRSLDEERWAEIERRRDAIWEQAEQIVRRGIESGDFDPGIDTGVAIRGIVGLTVWVYRWYSPGASPPAEAVADELSRMALHGVVRCAG
jgi:AcrR family transcriptional regulator